MACRVFTTRDGVTGFMCGPSPRKRKCAHCPCPDTKSLCDWPVVRPIAFEPASAVGVGDILVQRWPDGLSHGSLFRARTVEATPSAEGTWLVVKAVKLDSEHRIETKFSITPSNLATFRVEAPATCDKPCCFRCRLHVDKDRDYCRDHWDEMRAGKAQAELFA